MNASIGTSSDIVDVEMDVAKARVAEANGADTLMELSTGGDFPEIRRRVIEATTLSVCSVPLYQAFIEANVRVMKRMTNERPSKTMIVIGTWPWGEPEGYALGEAVPARHRPGDGKACPGR